MNFINEKKVFLEKLDKSKKGSIDEKLIPLISLINSKDCYYTTSSCSGRVVLRKESNQKNGTEWLNVSHDLVEEGFLKLNKNELIGDLIWLGVEPTIMHICCLDLESANKLLDLAKLFYKKSCLLSISNKIIVEIRGSETMEVPLYHNKELRYLDLFLLTSLVNEKLEKIFLKIKKFESKMR
ncbi:MAG: tRNA wybutosine-synthesizing 3 family protein [Candidatus Woesearchaeota archaeon]